MRVLIVEDDEALNRILTKRFKEKGFAVDSCFNGEDGLFYMQSMEYDCVILDWMMPKMDGAEVLKRYRQQKGEAPVLFLTARDEISDRVQGLDSGADDYLIKPFAFDELFARIRVLIRRGNRGSSRIFSIDNLEMDITAHTVKRDGKLITLTAREFALLEYFLKNRDMVLTRSQIAEHVWNYDFDYDSNIVDVYIRYLRNKIDKNQAHPLIHTVRGYGYVLRLENEEI